MTVLYVWLAGYVAAGALGAVLLSRRPRRRNPGDRRSV